MVGWDERLGRMVQARGQAAPVHGTRVERASALVARRPERVVLVWVALAVVLNILVPQLESVAGRDASPMVPTDAPSIAAAVQMDQAFGNGRSESPLVIAVERPGGLTVADQQYLVALARELRRDTSDVAFVQNVADPDLRKALTSKDGEARYLLVGATAPSGTPLSIEQVNEVRAAATEMRPDGLTVAVTGPTATLADLATATEGSVLRITVLTVLLIAVILLAIYRSVITAALILSVVGIGLAIARAVVAAMGLSGVFAVNTFAGTFLTALVLGAGTDYAVFLVSRYHEQRRLGVAPTRAAAVAASRIAGVIAGSALTVILATLCMAAADLGFFSTTGPALAVAIAVNLVVSLTLTPALLALAGRRGWAEPRPVSASGGAWVWIGRAVARRPDRMLALSLIPLALLACLYPLMDVSYNGRRTQPADTQSNQGYDLLARHYPINEVLPDYLLVHADHDLRNARDLAVLERAAATIARKNGVDMVRGITRPLGTPVKQASLGYQNKKIGEEIDQRIDEVTQQIGADDTGADKLAQGAGKLADGAGRLEDGTRAAVSGAGKLAAGSGDLATGVRKLLDGADDAVSGSGRLRSGAGDLADGLDFAASQVQVAVDGLEAVYNALRFQSLGCGLDFVCRQARDGIKKIWDAERDELLPGLRKAASGARTLASGAGDLQGGMRELQAGLEQARTGADQLAEGQRTFAAKMDDLVDGAGALAAGATEIQDSTSEVSTKLPELEQGMTQAADHLKKTGSVAMDPSIGGFYLPPAALENKKFAAARGLFLSEDGRTARYVVLGSTDAFESAAAARVPEIRQSVIESFSDTRLADAQVSMAGMAATNADLAAYAGRDMRLIGTGALIAVFLVLLALLRGLAAAVLLMGTVVLSYAAAMGASVLIWQVLLGQQLSWTVMAVSFVVLVAVGADYNLLLTKRIHEEAPDGSPQGIARATALTGGVITSAGVIFAASMFALMAGSVVTMVQVGLAIGIGLLLDTFVVRSLVVPSIATILGPKMWWPVRPPARPVPARGAVGESPVPA
ncbi:MMPL family transporter [Nocardioides sp. GY 10113]|uniref:MMPL family transporter n=1 Tax=Nocardioides sp. GY 10113 TaxID=2569761 RepID=UPI0014589240|nr:MMPL family transporter [Nocardioides sp. GY 10113]